MTDQGLILAPPTVRVLFAVEPVLNATDSLLLLSSFDSHQYGFPEWVTSTHANLSPEQRQRQELLVNGLKILDHEPNWPTFPAYIDYLASMDAVKLRDKAIQWLSDEEHMAKLGIEPVSQNVLLGDVQVYLGLQARIIEQYQQHYGDKEIATVNVELYTAIHGLLNDPVAFQKLAVEHLHDMWANILEPEWNRILPMLQESVRAFQQLDYTGLTAIEALRVVTGRDLSGKWDEDLRDVRELTFVPSAHIGPYVRLFTNHRDKSQAHIMFGARLPEGAKIHSPALDRSEMLVRLNALADDTRLQILELLTNEDELCAQDIINALNLSQSSASRHLRQLTASGYLIERRREVAKCYSLNRDRVEDTLAALRRFLKTN